MRWLGAAAFALLAGCGYVGPPLPPALYLPRPVADLRADVIGDRLIVRFTPPKLTTEDLPVTELRAITLFAGRGEAPFARERWAAVARQFQIPVAAETFELRASDFVGQELVLGLRTTGRTGRESDWSNLEIVPVAAPLTQPGNVVFESVPDAISLHWSGNAPRYRIARVVEGKLVPLAETSAAEYVDRAIVYGTRYDYVITGLAGERQQSMPSPPVSFTPTDSFPPGVPGRPSAITSGRAVDLSWTRSADDDLAGYNLYRATGDGPFEPLAQRVPLPAYNDTRVESGKRYRYTVSAVDVAGNESARSAEAAVQVE